MNFYEKMSPEELYEMLHENNNDGDGSGFDPSDSDSDEEDRFGGKLPAWIQVITLSASTAAAFVYIR